jgi:hypothetical protein
MPNGSRIVPDVGTSGYGVLEVQNGANEDTVVSLFDSATDEAVREVYVEALHSIRMKGIPRGTYARSTAARLSLTRVQFVERALQLFKLLPCLAELAFRRQALVVGKVFGGFRDERVEIRCGLGRCELPFRRKLPKFGDRKCPDDPRESFIAHPDAILFCRFLRE